MRFNNTNIIKILMIFKANEIIKLKLNYINYSKSIFL